VAAAVPRSVVAAPRSRGSSDGGTLVRASGGTSKVDEQATPLDVRVVTTKHEVRVASRMARGARSDDRACQPPIRCSSDGPIDDLHLCLCRRRRPPATTSSDLCFLFDYCVLCL
jgi:hypothetical protein